MADKTYVDSNDVYKQGIEKGRRIMFDWFEEREFEPLDHDDYWDSSDKEHPEPYHNPKYCRQCEWVVLKQVLKREYGGLNE